MARKIILESNSETTAASRVDGVDVARLSDPNARGDLDDKVERLWKIDPAPSQAQRLIELGSAPLRDPSSVGG